MFCDLVSSTALSAKLDPEDMRELLRAYQNTVSGEVARYEGHVAKLMGDGVLTYFGWPKAHEDEADRGDAWNGDAHETPLQNRQCPPTATPSSRYASPKRDGPL